MGKREHGVGGSRIEPFSLAQNLFDKFPGEENLVSKVSGINLYLYQICFEPPDNDSIVRGFLIE